LSRSQNHCHLGVGANAGAVLRRATVKDKQRERLPNRRAAESFNFEAGGLPYTCTIGRYTDRRLAEIFLTCIKSGSYADTCARDAAIVCSIALQCGAGADTIRHALIRDASGRPGDVARGCTRSRRAD
jgi:hypothetical protein